MDCIFCKIVKGEVPCHRIWENEKYVAFLSIFPNTEGFSVVVTREHYPSYAFEAADEVYQELVFAAREVARRIDKAFDDVGRTALIMEGMGVNHLHVKLFPMHGTRGEWQARHSNVDKYFEQYEGYVSSHDGRRADDEVLAKVAERIRKSE